MLETPVLLLMLERAEAEDAACGFCTEETPPLGDGEVSSPVVRDKVGDCVTVEVVAAAATEAAEALAIIRVISSSAHSFLARASCCCCSSVNFCPDDEELPVPPKREEKDAATDAEAAEEGVDAACCRTGVGLATGLAVMVTSGLPLAAAMAAAAAAASACSFCCFALLAAAKTSAMLLLKVSGMALDPCSPPALLLNSWLLLLEAADEGAVDFFDPELRALPMSEVLPRTGPLITLAEFFPGGSFNSCSKLDWATGDVLLVREVTDGVEDLVATRSAILKESFLVSFVLRVKCCCRI